MCSVSELLVVPSSAARPPARPRAPGSARSARARSARRGRRGRRRRPPRPGEHPDPRQPLSASAARPASRIASSGAARTREQLELQGRLVDEQVEPGDQRQAAAPSGPGAWATGRRAPRRPPGPTAMVSTSGLLGSAGIVDTRTSASTGAPSEAHRHVQRLGEAARRRPASPPPGTGRARAARRTGSPARRRPGAPRRPSLPRPTRPCGPAGRRTARGSRPPRPGCRCCRPRPCRRRGPACWPRRPAPRAPTPRRPGPSPRA